MTNCAIGYVNRIDATGVTFSASAEVAIDPAQNVADSQVGKRWRILAITGTLSVDFLSAVSMDVFSAFQPWDAEHTARGWNMLSATDTVRWKLGSTVGGTDGYDSGSIACNIAAGYGAAVHVAPATKTGRYLEFSFNAASYATKVVPQTFTDWGRLWCGPLITPSINPVYGYADEWRDSSEVSIAPRSGVEFVDELWQQRAVAFELNYLNEAEGRGTFKELSRVAGIRGQVLFMRDPSDSTYLPTEAILGRLERTAPIIHPAFSFYNRSFAIRQSQ